MDSYEAAFLLQLGTTIFGIYIPVVLVVLVARSRVCQHTGALALCRWSTRRLISLTLLSASVFLIPCYILANLASYSGGYDVGSHFILWSVFTDAASLLVLAPLVRRTA